MDFVIESAILIINVTDMIVCCIYHLLAYFLNYVFDITLCCILTEDGLLLYDARCSSLGPPLFLSFGIRLRYHLQAYDPGYLLISLIG